MLFNSYEFIFLFLPLTFAVFVALGAAGYGRACLSWLTLASLGFYAWWNPTNLLIIGPVVLANYFVARGIQRWADDRDALARTLMILGIVGNLCFLGYFKYVNFAMQVSNDMFGTDYVFDKIVLPLGISFITFQKIAFLVDVYTGRIAQFSFRQYGLFVFFFPQLIAGPIVHYREMMPQFDRVTGKVSGMDVAVGLSIFAVGLFKKVVLADGIAPHVSVLYAMAEGSQPVTLIYAWLATIGFTLQVYFDFSGYSEMAIGAARLFGIKLPMNFNAPLRATSIIDFWGRWHVTLVRFLTEYVFNPIAFAMTRRRVEKKLPPLRGPAGTSVGAFVAVLVLPTMVTMLISGLWHGAGYGYILWGLLHGLYLVVNHAWNAFRPTAWSKSAWYPRLMTPLGFILTFAGVVLAMAFFRAPTIEGGLNLAAGMFGLHGISLPTALGSALGDSLPSFVKLEWTGGRDFLLATAWTLVLLAIAWTLPGTLGLFAAADPALGYTPKQDLPAGGSLSVRLPLRPWTISAGWALCIAALASVAILALGQPTEFLYWQF